MGGGVRQGKARQGKTLLFLKKKKQKDFFIMLGWPPRICCRPGAQPTQRMEKSLFASFSSEKEESLPCLACLTSHPP
jgi:hypothetical protein